MKRYHLSKKESRKLRAMLIELFGEIQAKAYEVVEDRELVVYLADREPIVYRDREGRLLPLLYYLVRYRDLVGRLPSVVVDEGAVGPVSRGADVMAPGVVDVRGDFNEGDVVVVVDERHGMPIAVTIALVSSKQLRGMERGRVLKNVHHVGDKLWDLCKKL